MTRSKLMKANKSLLQKWEKVNKKVSPIRIKKVRKAISKTKKPKFRAQNKKRVYSESEEELNDCSDSDLVSADRSEQEDECSDGIGIVRKKRNSQAKKCTLNPGVDRLLSSDSDDDVLNF